MTSITIDFGLPPLRDDLQLLPGPEAFDGSPTWNIYDAIRHRYFRIGWLAFEILSRWNAGTASKLVREVTENSTARVTISDIEDLTRFLYANKLTRDPATPDSEDAARGEQDSKRNWLLWLLLNYLFIRIPLVRPHLFLKATLPYVLPLLSTTARNIFLLTGLVGIYLAARQWDTFIATFQYFFNFEGLLSFIIALIFIKVLHELGHAYVSMKYGCKVSTMGVAFLVLFPVLYTDTSDAWRLSSRRERLLIGAAGMMTELYIAMLCTFLWSLLPDGTLRSVAFMLATTSWVMSIAINVNIFMRFDGYYILSDWLGIENLQDRSYALGKWKLREILFGLGMPAPLRMQSHMTTRLIAYAWGSWIYRLVLFIGIALLVYFLFFKALGILLFITEIVWFILLPVSRELHVWWQIRDRILASGRTYISLMLVAGLIALLLVPWQNRIRIPAILEATEQASIYAPTPGYVESVLVRENTKVKEGDPLIILSSPSLDDELRRTRIRIDMMELRARRQAASDVELQNLNVILRQLDELNSRVDGLHELREQLTIRAPFAGRVTEVSEELHEGRWINEKLQLAHIIQEDELALEGLISERYLTRISLQQQAVFYPDEPERPVMRAVVSEIDDANLAYIERPYFISAYGGGIAAKQDDRGRYVADSGVYRVRFSLMDEAGPDIARIVRGVAHIEGYRRSLFSHMKERVIAVLIRESGF